MLQELKNHESSEIFRYPVNPIYFGIPKYYDIIKQPMDLQTIQHKLTHGLYNGKIHLFYEDIELMISNSLRFNKGNEPIMEATKYFRKYYEKTKEYVESAKKMEAEKL